MLSSLRRLHSCSSFTTAQRYYHRLQKLRFSTNRLLRRDIQIRGKYAGPGNHENANSVAQIVEYNSIRGAILTFPKRWPFTFNVLLSGTLMPGADFVIQLCEGGEINWRRILCFNIFGIYKGVADWTIYIIVFSRMFPKAVRFSNLSWAEKLKDRAGQKQIFGQVLVDLLGYMPFIYFPVFYSFKTLLQGDEIQNAFRKWKDNFITDNALCIAIFGVFDLVIFGVPAWARCATNHGISFSWYLLLSWMRGSFQQH